MPGQLYLREPSTGGHYLSDTSIIFDNSSFQDLEYDRSHTSNTSAVLGNRREKKSPLLGGVVFLVLMSSLVSAIGYLRLSRDSPRESIDHKSPGGLTPEDEKLTREDVLKLFPGMDEKNFARVYNCLSVYRSVLLRYNHARKYFYHLQRQAAIPTLVNSPIVQKQETLRALDAIKSMDEKLNLFQEEIEYLLDTGILDNANIDIQPRFVFEETPKDSCRNRLLEFFDAVRLLIQLRLESMEQFYRNKIVQLGGEVQAPPKKIQFLNMQISGCLFHLKKVVSTLNLPNWLTEGLLDQFGKKS